jgi:hypothetical protein
VRVLRAQLRERSPVQCDEIVDLLREASAMTVIVVDALRGTHASKSWKVVLKPGGSSQCGRAKDDGRPAKSSWPVRRFDGATIARGPIRLLFFKDSQFLCGFRWDRAPQCGRCFIDRERRFHADEFFPVPDVLLLPPRVAGDRRGGPFFGVLQA